MNLTLIDIVMGSCYYSDEDGNVYHGGINHPIVGWSAGRTIEDIGQSFFMKKEHLIKCKQKFLNGKLLYA